MYTNIDLSLNRAGWCDCRIEIGGQVIQFKGSYLTNPIKGLLAATSFVLLGGLRAQCVFHKPLGGYLVTLRRDKKCIVVSVMELFDAFESNAKIDGEIIFEANAGSLEFGEALYNSATSMVSEMSKKRFREIWADEDFPHFELYRLYTVIKSNALDLGGSQMSNEEISCLNLKPNAKASN